MDGDDLRKLPLSMRKANPNVDDLSSRGFHRPLGREVAAKASWLLGARAVDFHILRQRFRIVDAIITG